MQPCIGIPNASIPPLCSYRDLKDKNSGITLGDLKKFHLAYEAALSAHGG